MLVGMELSRAWLVTRFGKKKHFPDSIVGNSALYFPINSFAAAYGVPTQDLLRAIQVISSWLPLAGGKPDASFISADSWSRRFTIIRGLLAAFWWLCPILPNLDWAIKGLIGTVIPIIGIVAINNYYAQQAAE